MSNGPSGHRNEIQITQRQEPIRIRTLICHLQDGYEATKEIRMMEREKGTRQLIVALTASVLDNDEAKCRAAGEGSTGDTFSDFSNKGCSEAFIRSYSEFLGGNLEVKHNTR